MATRSTQSESPLIVIVGPTASGKTSLAIRLAKEYNGEIISADSRAIYRGLDIGTAKPNVEDRQGIVHWGIDIVDPGQRYTAADFKSYAEGAIADIRRRGKVPILVGGTGLYVDAIIFDYAFPSSGNDVARRSELDMLSIEELHEYCNENNVKLPENNMNKRYVVNTILRNGHALKKREAPIVNCIIVGITTEKNELKRRIHERARTIFSSDVVSEAEKVAASYGWDNEAMTGNIYPLIHQMQSGQITEDEAIDKFEILDWHLAKRQLTWLRRNKHIQWLNLGEAYTYLAQHLADVNKS